MPKKADEELHKHTLNLYAGDFEELGVLFPDAHPSIMVREIVRSTINRHKDAAAGVNRNIVQEVKL